MLERVRKEPSYICWWERKWCRQYGKQYEVKWKSLSHAQLSVTAWTIQAMNSLQFSIIQNSPGQNTGVSSLSLFQGIFPMQGSNPGLLHCRWILYQLSHKGGPRILEGVAYPSSSVSSRPRNQTRVSRIAGGFFTSWAWGKPMCVSRQCRWLVML